MKIICVFCLIAICLSSCIAPDRTPPFTNYTPVFIHRTELENSVQIMESRPIKKSGKIYLWEEHLFINEPYKGVHVFNNKDPENPQEVGFIRIFGNIDIAIRNGVLLADNAVDLVAIDISDINNVEVVNRVRNVFPVPSPPDNQVVPDIFSPQNRPDSLIVVDWLPKN